MVYGYGYGKVGGQGGFVPLENGAIIVFIHNSFSLNNNTWWRLTGILIHSTILCTYHWGQYPHILMFGDQWWISMMDETRPEMGELSVSLPLCCFLYLHTPVWHMFLTQLFSHIVQLYYILLGQVRVLIAFWARGPFVLIVRYLAYLCSNWEPNSKKC